MSLNIAFGDDGYATVWKDDEPPFLLDLRELHGDVDAAFKRVIRELRARNKKPTKQDKQGIRGAIEKNRRLRMAE